MESNEGGGSLRAPTEQLSNLRLSELRIRAIGGQGVWEVLVAAAEDSSLVARARNAASGSTFVAKHIFGTQGAAAIDANRVMFVISPHLCPIGVA